MKHPWAIILCGLLMVTTGCQMINPPEPTGLFPTPDLTMTAIYSILYETQETPTSPPLAVTDTPPATVLPFPTFTPTSLPPTLTETAWPTVTQEPTFTPLPTLTSVPPTSTFVPPTSTPRPLVRTGASITATYLGVRPDINGYLGEWNLTKYGVTAVVYGANLWDNAADLSARVMVGWDAANLYLAAEVIDEDYEQNTGGVNLFKGDSLEVLLDTNLTADYYVNTLSADDFQLGISPGSPLPDEDPEAYLWFPAAIDGGRSQVTIAAVRTDDGYNVEVAIPWIVFEMVPQAGQHYGFALSISDNDIDGGIAQQSMISNVASRILANPTTWGDLLLYRP